MIEALKACPFCGGDAGMSYYTREEPGVIVGYFVECNSCSATSEPFDIQGEAPNREDYTKTEAIAAWNQRATPSAIQPSEGEVERVTSDVLAERRRQIEVEGWTPQHDDEHGAGELADAAACYAAGEMLHLVATDGYLWPWSEDWWKPTDRRRELIKAGALILAEIERLDRAAIAAMKGEG
jgi:Lar family restriction alleviation protein